MNRNFINDNIQNLNELESIIGYTFKDRMYLLLALTHSSYANEKRVEGLNSNERLEFLGDSVLNIVTSEFIYKNFPALPEGEMTKTRASIVCEGSLMICASKIMLGNHILLGRGEENTGGRSRTSILSDAFEALIGAIYLDGGLNEAASFIHRSMSELFNDSGNSEIFVDYKTQLQEIIQKSGEQKVNYRIIEEKGPDHNKQFVAQISVGDVVLGRGEGKSKKEAEQNAAKAALNKLQVK
jgi:ribonuclease III